MSAWLDGELTAVRGELARVDAKCGVLSAVATGAAAFTATQTSHGPLAVSAVMAASGAVFIAAVVVLLVTLRPGLGTGGWCRYVPMPTSDIEHLDRNGWIDSGYRRIYTGDFGPEDLAVLARIAGAKFRRLQLAVDLTGAGVLLLGAGVVAGVIA